MFTQTQIDFIKRVAEQYELGDVMVDDDGISVGDTFYIEATPHAVQRKTIVGDKWAGGFIATAVYMTYSNEWGYDGDEVEVARDTSIVNLMKECVMSLKEDTLYNEMWGLFNEINETPYMMDMYSGEVENNASNQ